MPADRARPAASVSSSDLPIPASPVTSRTWLDCGTGSTSARSRASPASRPMMGAGCCAGSSPGPGICLSSRPLRFVNAVPRLNSDRGPGMPAARKVLSSGGYRLRLSAATVSAAAWPFGCVREGGPGDCRQTVRKSQTGTFPPPFMGRVDLRLHPDDAAFATWHQSGQPLMRGWFRLPRAEPVDSLALLCAVDAFPPTA